ncbi:hypothetical protein WR25_14092 [Diploscapter pachys]|uniref:Uncharacterized protein n=1 Tax=Diploscapter pachys TaxID=2018661 RepID=A0A2A2K824_9BILA|nr:hypothetical protein WR25_14092 [Diploscapter pachys]
MAGNNNNKPDEKPSEPSSISVSIEELFRNDQQPNSSTSGQSAQGEVRRRKGNGQSRVDAEIKLTGYIPESRPLRVDILSLQQGANRNVAAERPPEERPVNAPERKQISGPNVRASNPPTTHSPVLVPQSPGGATVAIRQWTSSIVSSSSYKLCRSDSNNSLARSGLSIRSMRSRHRRRDDLSIERVQSVVGNVWTFLQEHPMLSKGILVVLGVYMILCMLETILPKLAEIAVRCIYPCVRYVTISLEQWCKYMHRMLMKADEFSQLLFQATYCDFARRWCKRFHLMCDSQCSFLDQVDLSFLLSRFVFSIFA